MKLQAEPSFTKRPKSKGEAVSVCLWSSDKWSNDKHWVPFERFMLSHPTMDVLVYHERGHPLAQRCSELGARTFEVTSNETGFHRHFWRYIGGSEGYERVWFRGMDGIKTPDRELRLMNAVREARCDFLIWQLRESLCMGKLAASADGGMSLLHWLRNNHWIGKSNVWDCDERTLDKWVRVGDARIGIAVDSPQVWQMGWFLERLLEGNHTIILKDRDDRR